MNSKELGKWWFWVLSITHCSASRASPSSLTRQAAGTLEHTPRGTSMSWFKDLTCRPFADTGGQGAGSTQEAKAWTPVVLPS